MSQSLECPRCNGAVSVDEHAAGKRVKCPHCDETFLAPGITPQENDDDDWLNLDEVAFAPGPGEKRAEPEMPLPQETSPEPEAASSPADSSASPKFSADDEALLAEFTDELDEFTAEIESPPRPHPSAAAVSTNSGGGKSPIGAAGGTPSASSPAAPEPVADAVEYATEYRVKCNICGTFLYAKAHQAGKTLKCSDCFSPVTVPPPPKVRKDSQINIADAETFQFEETRKVSRGPDPYKKSAEQLLEEASQEEEINENPVYDDTPSVKAWLLNVFGVYKDLGVLVHWAALVVLGAVPAMIALKLDHPVLILGLFPGGFFLSVLVVSCGFAILHAVANEEETVTDWPTLDPFAWLEQLFVVVAAACVAVVPMWAICMMILGPSLISIAITMLSVYLMFPFVLLSMLDMNSPLVPFSPEVARSVTKCEEAWGGFYFSSGLLFIGLFLVFATASGMSPASAAALGIFATVGVAFAYFAMIGRLAYAIGQSVNAPPRHDEGLDRTRHTDVS